MPLGINTNLSAQGIIKNLETSSANFQKSVNKLSTGLRINSAADDPAGLILAQKYQSQVNGLGQAVSNARDAMNLVQTAEGAMDQISSQLQSMRTLALHAANSGVNDAAARAADQKQIDLALSTIDRIASNTQFGNKKLLDGSAGFSGTTTDANTSYVTASTATKAGTYTVQVTQAARQGQVQGAALKQVKVEGAGGTLGETASALATLDIQTDSAGNVSASHVKLDIGGMNLDQVVSTINGDSRLQGKVVASKTSDGKNLVVKTAEITNTTAGNEANDLAVIFDNGNATAKFGLESDNGGGGAAINQQAGGVANDAQSLAQADSSARTVVDQTLTLTDGGSKSVAVVVKAGTSLAAAVSQVNSAVGNAGIAVTASLTSEGRFQIQNNDYGNSTAVANTLADSGGNAANNDLQIGNGATSVTGQAIAAASAFTVNQTGLNVAGTINGNTATGSGQVMTGGDGFDEEGLQVRYSGSTVPAGNNAGTVTVNNNAMTMQIGAFAGQTATIGINGMSTSDLGKSATGTSVLTGSNVKLANIDVTVGADGAGAQDALRVIDAAITQVATARGELGAFQTQTLEATIRNSQTAQTNLTTTLSDIQDANVAQETVAFTRTQILQQQAVSMLATANQNPQLLLRLFQ